MCGVVPAPRQRCHQCDARMCDAECARELVATIRCGQPGRGHDGDPGGGGCAEYGTRRAHAARKDATRWEAAAAERADGGGDDAQRCAMMDAVARCLGAIHQTWVDVSARRLRAIR